MKALVLRERQTDVYDPDTRFKWIVETDSPVECLDPIVVQRWTMHDEAPLHDFCAYGRKVGFVNRDDAMLFYLKYA